jgi:hypothetical protein
VIVSSRRLVFGVAASALLSATAAASCVYSPTAIDVSITTVGICDRSPAPPREASVSIFVGDDRDIPRADVATCGVPRRAPGDVGNVVLTPAGGRSASFNLEVREGVGCASGPTVGPACIVARRRVSFREHERVVVPIELREECRGNPCPDGQTCIAGGRCVDIPRLGEDAPPPEEAGLPLPIDASIGETGIGPAVDGATLPVHPPNGCGDEGIQCGTGVCRGKDRCCRSANGPSQCAAVCPTDTTFNFACDDGFDCVGLQLVCCMRALPSGKAFESTCSTSCVDGVVLCSPQPCSSLPGKRCLDDRCNVLTCAGAPVTTCSTTCP